MTDETTMAAIENPHVLWRQVLGFVIWTTLLSLPTGGPLGALLALSLGGATFADAWRSGIYKHADRKSFLNLSPMAWGIVMSGLFVVAYPAYLINRNRMRTIQAGNGFYVATTILGALFIALITIAIIGGLAA